MSNNRGRRWRLCQLGVLTISLMGSGIAKVSHGSDYSDAVLALNPDAYYRFDGSGGAGSDETGNHDFDSVEGGISFNVAGPRPGDFLGMDAANDAWDFISGTRAQVSDYVPAAGEQPRTVIAWFNTDVTPAVHGGAIDVFSWNSDINNPNTFKGWSLKIAGGFDGSTGQPLGYDVAALNIQGREVQGSTTPINIDQWHMVGIVYNGGTIGTSEMYVDGVLQTLINDTGVTPADPGSDPVAYGFSIGRALGGFAMDGQIDHVAVFTGDLGGISPVQGPDVVNLWNAATGMSTVVDGDFNNDDMWDCLDINALVGEIVAGTDNAEFDMNGDGEVNLADITDADNGWLAVGGENNSAATGGNPFLEGDANLDGSVDVSDFNEWNSNKFTDAAEWCSGDFNADGSVDVSDFNVWNGTKFTSSGGPAVVPEPGTTVLGLLALLALVAARDRR